LAATGSRLWRNHLGMMPLAMLLMAVLPTVHNLPRTTMRILFRLQALDGASGGGVAALGGAGGGGATAAGGAGDGAPTRGSVGQPSNALEGHDVLAAAAALTELLHDAPHITRSCYRPSASVLLDGRQGHYPSRDRPDGGHLCDDCCHLPVCTLGSWVIFPS
jgi:hypothetical protein